MLAPSGTGIGAVSSDTPKNFLGGDKTTDRFRGYSLQGWFASDLTGDPHRGLGSWSVEDIAAYLKTGHGRNTIGTGLMAETISNSTSHMSDADLKAIATYLKDPTDHNAGGNESSQPISSNETIMKSGSQIYADECSGCHGADGKGTAGLFPALSGSAIAQQTDATSLMHVILRGAHAVATDRAPTGAGMPEFGWLLGDEEVAAVLTYIRNSWGNAAPAVIASEVGKARHALAERSD